MEWTKLQVNPLPYLHQTVTINEWVVHFQTKPYIAVPWHYRSYKLKLDHPGPEHCHQPLWWCWHQGQLNRIVKQLFFAQNFMAPQDYFNHFVPWANRVNHLIICRKTWILTPLWSMWCWNPFKIRVSAFNHLTMGAMKSLFHFFKELVQIFTIFVQATLTGKTLLQDGANSKC